VVAHAAEKEQTMIEAAWTAEEAAEQQETDWAVQEFGAAQLGDARRTARLVRLARQVSARPQVSLAEACGDAASLKAAYRFFDNDAVSDVAVLASHVQATSTRVAAESVVLAVQDTTLLDWTAHPATTGLGMLASTRQHAPAGPGRAQHAGGDARARALGTARATGLDA
jgi:Transposase DNA-binding